MSVILTETVPFLLRIVSLQIGIIIKVIVPGYQKTGVIKLYHGIGSVYQVRINPIGYYRAHRLRRRLS